MRYLLDTQAFLWLVTDDPATSAAAKACFTDPLNDPCLSLASVWEIAIKASIGKLRFTMPLEKFISDQLQKNRIVLLQVGLEHALHVASLPFHHRDPFDRMLAAQAICDALPVVSNDAAFDLYGVTRIW